jgi:hypothetical protein
MFIRKKCQAAAFVVITGLSICAPALPARAQVIDPGEACSTPTGEENQGNVAGTNNQICQSVGGPIFIGPQIGQVATVIGPTIIGPSQVGTVVVSPGNVIAG